MANLYYEKLEELDGMERELYRILKTFMNNSTCECYPSINTLAKLFKRCRNTTKSYLKKLKEKGFILIKIQKVTHKVTNNVYNEPNLYTLLLDKLKGSIDRIKKPKENEKVELKETKLETIVRELKEKYDENLVEVAVKTMKKNQSNGYIIKYPKNYLISLIKTSNKQIEESKKLIESFENKVSTSTKANVSKPLKHRSKPYKTRFHNFKGRTSEYTEQSLDNRIKDIMKEQRSKSAEQGEVYKKIMSQINNK